MMTEKQMREAKDPWPKTARELVGYLAKMRREAKSFRNKGEGYGKGVYAMSLAATAAFNYMAHVVGASGFQAGCASADFFKRARSLEHGFMSIDFNDLLYPQLASDNDRFPTALRLLLKNAKWARAEARKLLKKNPKADPEVIKWWEQLTKLPLGEGEKSP